MQPYLFVGIEGLRLSASDKHRLSHPAIAGVILFTRNYQSPPQLKQLCQHIKQTNQHFKIAVDHEGGRVQRFQSGFTTIPSAHQYLLDSKQQLAPALKHIKQDSKKIATELASCGININFAPVTDLDYGRSQVIQQRCYSSDAEIVSQCATAFIQDHHSIGIETCAKHFPGHGYATADSHLEIAIDERDSIQNDLIPYQNLLGSLKNIMLAHVVFPKLDAELASFSPYWIQTVLKQQLGFTGKIFSDDLQMHGCAHLGNAEQRIKKALNAGCDYLIWGNDLAELDGYLKTSQFN